MITSKSRSPASVNGVESCAWTTSKSCCAASSVHSCRASGTESCTKPAVSENTSARNRGACAFAVGAEPSANASASSAISGRHRDVSMHVSLSSNAQY